MSEGMIGLVCGIVLPLLLAFQAIGFATFILRPLARKADASPRNTQFTLPDIACLMVHLSMLAGLVSSLAPDASVAANWREPAVDVLFFCLLFFGLIELVGSWWLSVRCLSVSRVTSMPRRAVFQLLAVPVAVFGPLLSMVVLAGTLFALYEYLTTPGRSAVGWLGAAAGLAGLVGICVADFWLVRWVAAGAASSPSATGDRCADERAARVETPLPG